MKISRRKWLGRALFYGTPGAGFAYGSGYEKRNLALTRADIPLAPNHAALAGLRIAVMGDFHHDDFGEQGLIRRAVEAINAEGVDFVFLVGDYISDDAAAIVPLCEELRNLRAGRGTFAVLGNHDKWHLDPILPRTLREAGFRVLLNEIEDFGGFTVAGMDSFWGGKPDLGNVMRRIAPEQPVLMLWHEPDTFDFHNDPRIALQVSGHTHGGQICAPVYGPIILPQYGRRYPYGHYRKGDSSLFVTRGIGTLDIPARFLCAPEVAILTLGS